MTLDELLALLPDNDTGDIGADDLRTVVTELYQAAHTHLILEPYQYTNSATPAAGKINIIWDMTATSLNVAEAASSGTQLPFEVIDSNQTNRFNLSNADDTLLIRGTITDVCVDNGTYRTWPVTLDEVRGSTPGNNLTLTFAVGVFLEVE